MPRVYVVGDHDEALEAIHEAIRERVAPMHNLAMVHFDAHPDLSVPRRMPASAVYSPGALYEHLSDGDGGISEWILPLVMAEHLSTVWWVRPEWTHDIPDGCHSVAIGAVEPTPEELLAEEDGNLSPAHNTEEYRGPPDQEALLASRHLRVATELQYWCDDHWCVADPARMHPRVDFNVLVSTAVPIAVMPGTRISAPSYAAALPQNGSTEDQASSLRSPKKALSDDWTERITSHAGKVQGCDGWVLDICLDYFGTHNPFAFQLASRGGHRLAAALQAAAAGARTHGATESIYEKSGRRGDAEASAHAPTDSCEAAHWLEEGLTHVLRELKQTNKAHSGSPVTLNVHEDDDVQNDINYFERLLSLYATRNEGENLVENLAAEASVAMKTPKGGALLDLALAMVPCACLPNHPGSGGQTHIYLQNLRSFLCMPEMQQLGLPCAITLARSSGDPFTPPERLRWLEAEVKELVLELYGCGGTPSYPTLPSGYYGAAPIAIARKSAATANANVDAQDTSEASEVAAPKKQRQSETTFKNINNNPKSTEEDVDGKFTNWLEEHHCFLDRGLKRKHIPSWVRLGLPEPNYFTQTLDGGDGSSSSDSDGVGYSIRNGASDGQSAASGVVDSDSYSHDPPALLSMCRAGALLKAKAWSLLHPSRLRSSNRTAANSPPLRPKDAQTWWVCSASIEAKAMISAVQNQSITSSSNSSSSLASQERQPMQGEETNGCVVYANMSQLLADAVEWWAHSSVLDSDLGLDTNSGSSSNASRSAAETSSCETSSDSSGLSVHGGCTRWVFPDGALFGADAKWWDDKPRGSPHEGLDFVSYFDLHGIARDVQPGTPVAPLLPGTVVAIFPDFMRTTVVVATSPTTIPTEQKLNGDRSLVDDLSENRFLAPNLCVETWPVGRKLLMVYAHIVVADGLAVGSVLNSPLDRVGTVATAKSKPSHTAASGSTGGSSSSSSDNIDVNRHASCLLLPRPIAGAPPHLHLSLAWAPLEAPPPEGWRDLVNPSADAQIELAEPPIPAGFWE